MPIAITFAIACLVLCLLVFRKHGIGRTESLLLGALTWGALVTLITECLGVAGALAFRSLAISWSVASLLLCGALLKSSRTRPDRVLANAALTRSEYFLSICLFGVVAVTAVLAYVAAPNTWDSMTYHLSRVAHWMQNRSIEFYPTPILRQLHSNPWAEYAILNFQLLSGSDRFANFVQWLCMVGSLVGTAAIAEEFGASRGARLFAAITCATIPMGVLQATSTQTDYAVAFWLLCFAYFLLRFTKQPDLLRASAMGVALGLALLSKGTAYVFAFPFVAWLVIFALRQRDRRILLLTGLTMMIALLANAGHYARNYDLYGKPLGPGSEGGAFSYANQTLSPSVLASGVLRNVGLHLSVTEQTNKLAEKAIYRLHDYLGISANDSGTTWPGTEFRVHGPSHNEDDAGNPFHLILIAASVALYLCGMRREQRASAYMVCVAMAFLLFCLSLKWQPWHSRLHLPLFVLCAPFVGLILSRFQGLVVRNVLAAALIVASVPNLLSSTTKPIKGKDSIFRTERIDQYFIKRPGLKSPYLEAAKIIRETKCRDVGLFLDQEGWEYPLWMLLNTAETKPVRLTHVNVMNISARKRIDRPGGSVPCAILALDSGLSMSVAGKSYGRLWAGDGLSVYQEQN